MKKAYLITGCIGSGKSTYAKKAAGENDIVFDLDEINKAMGGKIHEDSARRLPILLAMRDAAFSEIAKRSGEWENAYVITASNDRTKINDLLKLLNAEEVAMDASIDECKRRVMEDETRPDKGLQIRLIEDWFKNGKEEPKQTRDRFAEWFDNTF